MASADVDDVPEVLLDEGIMIRMRLIIENLLHVYNQELQVKDVSEAMVQQRCDELHRLLFKLAEVTVSEMVDATVSEMKVTFLEDIKHMIRSKLLAGQFKQALIAKECLQTILSKSLIARVSLEALPFSRRLEVEAAQEEIEQVVDDLIRKVQLYHSNEATADFEQLMHLDVDYSDSDDSDDGESDADGDAFSSSSDDNSTEPEDSEEDIDVEQEPTNSVKSAKKSLQAQKLSSKVAPMPLSVKKDSISATKAAPVKKTPVQKSPARVTRKRKDTATPVDDEVSVTEKRATRSCR